MLPRKNFRWGEGERERLMARRRFVFEKARDSYNIDEITDLWNEHCDAEGRPDEQRSRSRIADDLREGLKELAAETKIDAEVYRIMLIGRIEQAFSTERFRNMIRDGHLGAIDRLLKGVAQIAQLTGANAPIKTALTDSQGKDVVGLSDAERSARIAALFQTAKQRAEELGVIIDAELVPEKPRELSVLDAVGGTNQNTEGAESSVS